MQITVTGVAGVVRSLAELAAQLDRLDLDDAGPDLVAEARAGINSRTGTLAGTVRAEGRPGRLTVTAGGPGAPYAGVYHYGGYHGIEPHPFLTDAGQNTDLRPAADREIRGLVRRLDLT